MCVCVCVCVCVCQIRFVYVLMYKFYLLFGRSVFINLKGSVGVVSDLFKFFFYITIKNLLDRLKTIIITLNFRTPAVFLFKSVLHLFPSHSWFDEGHSRCPKIQRYNIFF